MWILILFPLVLAHGSLADVDCSRDTYDVCKSPALFDFFPADVVEFNRLCPQLSAYLSCLKAFQDQCGSRIFDSEEEYNGMLSAFNDVCKEGTLFNRVATENLKCFNETFRTTSCPEKVKAVTGPFRSPMLDTEDEDDYDLPIVVMCLQNILESDCIAADLGKNCGQEALEATVEFFRRTNYIGETCGKRSAEILLKNLGEYNLDEEQKMVVIATLEQVIISDKN